MHVFIRKKINRKYSNLLYYFFKANLPKSLLSNIEKNLFFKFCKHLEENSKTKYYYIKKKKILSCLIFTKNGCEVINFLRKNSFNILISLLFNLNFYKKYLILNSFFGFFYNPNKFLFENEIVIIATNQDYRSKGFGSLLIQKSLKDHKFLNVKSEFSSKKFYLKNKFRVVLQKKIGLKNYFFLKNNYHFSKILHKL